jgi:hypothetical protein
MANMKSVTIKVEEPYHEQVQALSIPNRYLYSVHDDGILENGDIRSVLLKRESYSDEQDIMDILDSNPPFPIYPDVLDSIKNYPSIANSSYDKDIRRFIGILLPS